MKNKKIFKINCDYSQQVLFSYLKYPFLLKLVKYNKSLQNILNIKIENYQSITGLQYIKRKITREYYNAYEGHYKRIHENRLIRSFILKILYSFYFLIYAFIINTFFPYSVELNSAKLYNKIVISFYFYPIFTFFYPV